MFLPSYKLMQTSYKNPSKWVVILSSISKRMYNFSNIFWWKHDLPSAASLHPLDPFGFVSISILFWHPNKKHHSVNPTVTASKLLSWSFPFSASPQIYSNIFRNILQIVSSYTLNFLRKNLSNLPSSLLTLKLNGNRFYYSKTFTLRRSFSILSFSENFPKFVTIFLKFFLPFQNTLLSFLDFFPSPVNSLSRIWLWFSKVFHFRWTLH